MLKVKVILFHKFGYLITSFATFPFQSTYQVPFCHHLNCRKKCCGTSLLSFLQGFCGLYRRDFHLNFRFVFEP